jgi:hypothetical protein
VIKQHLKITLLLPLSKTTEKAIIQMMNYAHPERHGPEQKANASIRSFHHQTVKIAAIFPAFQKETSVQ